MSGLKKLLIASVVINVIALGVIGGHMLKREFEPHPARHKMMHAVIASLPDDKQQIARAEYKKAMNENRKNIKEEAKAREDYFNVLRAKKFDEEKLEAAAARLHALRGAMVSRMQDATKAIVKDLNYKERVQLANALERMMQERFGKGKPPHDGPRGPKGHRPPPPRD